MPLAFIIAYIGISVGVYTNFMIKVFTKFKVKNCIFCKKLNYHTTLEKQGEKFTSYIFDNLFYYNNYQIIPSKPEINLTVCRTDKELLNEKSKIKAIAGINKFFISISDVRNGFAIYSFELKSIILN